MPYAPPRHSQLTRNPFRPDPSPFAAVMPSVDQVQVREQKEYTYDLFNKAAGKPWATLSLLGDAEYSKSIPAFVEGSPVTGEVRLDLESGDGIHAVLFSIKGQITTGATPSEMMSFIDLSTTLWSRSMGDPRQPGDGNTAQHKWNQRLKGKYVWPFSISLPPTVCIPGAFGGQDEVFRLPQTFFERHTRAQIEYEVVVRFTRTKLRSDHRLSTTLNYMPLSAPGPPSRLRQLAYQQHTALLGPDSDPDGWRTLPFIQARGKLTSTSRPVDARCRLSLATPLCYTRGEAIPCALVIECSDPQALELLASPDAPVLRLRRAVRFLTGEKAAKEELDHSASATWWPAADRALDTDSTDTLVTNAFRRMLKGEIHLKPELITSSSIAHFRIEYSVVLFPFDAPGYATLDSEPLIVEPVEIASEYASGPRPLKYSSPLSVGT
ncbi:hypothetical protein B0H17DRAFT_520623 [Mycena rosella]|uniref:Arrestin-like N-terminal domain-containing protein n=1 Tax=Mycena rosella TaxID=1033263 RepID=A0AAD7GXM1_MYCRO|nr:hypothetical protein B0H17DRAFT_520623 [Mycena rosella]